MTRAHFYKKTLWSLNFYEWLILSFSLSYAIYWLMVSPIQYTGDSEGYLGIARMLLGKCPSGIPPIFRTPGYPLLLILTGAVIPGSFIPLLITQALLASLIPLVIYRILLPYGQRVAFIGSILAILSGTTTAHVSQIMSETLFTSLLFVGLGLTIKIIREKRVSSRLFYWMAFIFAVLNTVRPISWLIFWPLLFVITVSLVQKNTINLLKSILGSALIYIALMGVWTVADDVLFSFGARYSPLLPLKPLADSCLDTYLFDIPFNETYFSSWAQHVENITPSLPSAHSNPALTKIQTIVLKQVIDNKTALTNMAVYPYQLFGKYLDQPEKLVERMFSFPNYKYASFVYTALEQHVSKKERHALFYSAAKEAGRAWPQRWVTLLKQHPFALISGPNHGNGSNLFLLAYTSLQHYQDPGQNNKDSLIDEHNGPATQLLFTTLNQGLEDNPELWQGTNGLWGSHLNSLELILHTIITNPNQQYAWEITVMLWDMMGYNTMSHLLGQVAKETFNAHKKALALRVWDTSLMVAAGPGYIEIDSLNPQFGQIEIYDYLETAQLSARQKRELRSTEHHYQSHYEAWQAPIKWGYFLFYLCKPIFLFTSAIALFILWSRNHNLAIPLVLMIPYGISIGVYGALFTALPRYTDPTILLPFIVTCMAMPELIKMVRGRRKNNCND